MNEIEGTRVAMARAMTGYDIFEHKTEDGKCPYRFLMPGIGISGRDVTVDWDRERKQWHMVQRDDGGPWEAWGDTQPECIIALISLRVVGKLPIFQDPEQT